MFLLVPPQLVLGTSPSLFNQCLISEKYLSVGFVFRLQNLLGMPGEEAQLSTSTVTEETDTELGRLSTLTLWTEIFRKQSEKMKAFSG